MAARLQTAEQEHDARAAELQKLSADHLDVCQRFRLCADREKVLVDKVQAFDHERENWLKQNEEQAAKINKLEEALAASQDAAKKLGEEKKGLTADLAQAEVIRHNLVKSFIPTVVRRLLDSAEYKQSLAKPLSLSFSAGWQKGVGVNRSPEEVEKIFNASKKLNREAPSI